MTVRVRDASERRKDYTLHTEPEPMGFAACLVSLQRKKKMTGLAVDQELEAVSQPRSKSAESSYASMHPFVD